MAIESFLQRSIGASARGDMNGLDEATVGMKTAERAVIECERNSCVRRSRVYILILNRYTSVVHIYGVQCDILILCVKIRSGPLA